MMRIDDIGVGDPCCESWGGMRGDERRRHCDECDKDVVNLSALSRSEASEIVFGPGSQCVRFRRDDTGNIVFRDVRLREQRLGARELMAAAACVAPFVLWAALVSPINDATSWAAVGLDSTEFDLAEYRVGSATLGILVVPEDGHDYDSLPGKPQAVIFVDENGTPRLDKHQLPKGQDPSDGVPRLVVPD